jgi:hypothetical protein
MIYIAAYILVALYHSWLLQLILLYSEVNGGLGSAQAMIIADCKLKKGESGCWM